MKTKKEGRKFSAGFKSKVAIESIKERQTIQELAAKYELHPTEKIVELQIQVDFMKKVLGK